MYKSVNMANHIFAQQYGGLGPADVRQPNLEFWKAKAILWAVPEGVARTRLCMNCDEYQLDEEIQTCIDSGEGGQMKASELPFNPRWSDEPVGQPSGICKRYHITCSALRTCNDWEPIMEEDDGMQTQET